MTAANREPAILVTLDYEGGYSNDRGDPGGPTNWGITIADARRYWKAGASAADVRAMPRSIAVNIYRQKYWKTEYFDCDHLADGVDLAVFDYGVNSGPSRAYKALMASVGGAPTNTVVRICAYRMSFLRNLGTYRIFGRGWSRRVAGIQTIALKMAAHPNPPPIVQPRKPTMPIIALNWKTTIAGAVPIIIAGVQLLGVVIPGVPAIDIGSALGLFFVGLFAKDATAPTVTK